jgi:hypothetical protein
MNFDVGHSTQRADPLRSPRQKRGFALQIDPPIVPPSSSFTKGREQYRLYCLDGSNHITKSHEFHAKDDREAIKTANAWRSGGKAELWCRGRKVHAFEASR